MTTIDNDSLVKISKYFVCELCDYSTSRKYNLELHYQSNKHKKLILTTINNEPETNLAKLCKQYECQNCDKSFNDRAGLWRHKKKCKEEKQNEIMNDKELIQYLLKENSEFKQLMIDQNKQMIELAKNSGNNNNNTTNNNQQFNLNFYLNETCKNAMNIMDFVSQLNVSIKDLEDTGRLGYAEGISKIFINGLKQMNVSDRPIHCSDQKRETLYIKDNNEWNKEGEDKSILTNAIKHVAHKNMKKIPEWTKLHPDFKNSSSKENDRYLKIVSESMSGTTEEEATKNYTKIIKNIVKETVIDKTIDIV
jgi:hypothetical protein